MSKSNKLEKTEDAVIIVENVWESFRIYHHRNYTIKDTLVRLKKSQYEDFWALKNVSFNITKGETIGIIGENGSGKSTLLKCIAGVLLPSKGQIKVKGRISPLLELGAGFHPELSGRENIYINGAILGLTKKQIDAKYDEIVAFAELEEFIDNQVKFYSSGMYIRLGFAVAVFSDPDILLVDEILAVGDEHFRKKSFDKMKEFKSLGKTIILVTHDLGTAARFCDRLILLKKGVIEKEGKPKNIIKDYINASLQAEKTAEKGKKDIAITEVELLDKELKPKSNFLPGESLKIRIHYDAKTTTYKPVFGINIQDQIGNNCFGTNTKLKNFSIESLKGKGFLDFDLINLPMADGKFYLTIAIHSYDEKTFYHWLDKHYFFEIDNASDDLGSVFIKTTCELQQANEKELIDSN